MQRSARAKTFWSVPAYIIIKTNRSWRVAETPLTEFSSPGWVYPALPMRVCSCIMLPGWNWIDTALRRRIHSFPQSTSIVGRGASQDEFHIRKLDFVLFFLFCFFSALCNSIPTASKRYLNPTKVHYIHIASTIFCVSDVCYRWNIILNNEPHICCQY